MAPRRQGVEDAPSTAITIIEPSLRWGGGLGLTALWKRRELLYFLVWRDVKVRYKQTAIGAAWAVVQPLALMVVFTIFIGQLAGVGPRGVPYPVFTLAALVPWTFFSQALSASAASLVGNAQLVSKVYFPRLLVPCAAASSFLVDLVASMSVLFVVLAIYTFPPALTALLLPVFLVQVYLISLGAGLLLSALNVRFRDVRYVTPFLVQIWLFATPVAYQFSIVPNAYRLLFALNPMVGAIEGFRAALTGAGGVPADVHALSVVVTAALLVGGLVYFRRTERTFADVI